MTHTPAGRVVTLTANPSLDRTLTVPAPLERGGVVRLGPSSTEPGGKGVNVARAIAAAGSIVQDVREDRRSLRGGGAWHMPPADSDEEAH